MSEAYEPDVFEFSVLGLLSFDEISMIWHGDFLVYYRGNEEAEFKPSEKDWEYFWKTLDRIGAWDWKGKYVDKNVLDGEQWWLTIIHRDKEINCAGSNAYPDGFEEFRRSLNHLVNL